MAPLHVLVLISDLNELQIGLGPGGNVTLIARACAPGARAFSFADVSVVTPARLLASTLAFFSHSFSECAEQPIFDAIETIACQRDGCSAS